MKKLLEGTAGVITGAAGGIGRAAALLFAEEGARVVVADYNEAGGLETVEMVKSYGGEAVFCYCDVRIEEQVKHLMDFTVKTYGRLDWAVNNAGIPSEEANPIHATSTELFNNIIATNMFSIYYCIKYQAPYMMEHGGGNIVNMLSISSTCCTPNAVGYATSKFGAYGITQCAALEYAKYNIRVNGVGPGPTLTPMITEQSMKTHPELMAALATGIPDGRMGEPREPAQVALFLVSDMSSHITGQLIVVDGGTTVKM